MSSEEGPQLTAEEASEVPPTPEITRIESAEEVTFTYEELKDDFICHQTTEKDNAIFTALQAGFNSLQEARDTNKTPVHIPFGKDVSGEDGGGSGSQKSVTMRVAVSVIDPTTKPGRSLTAPKADNLLAKSRIAAPSTTVSMVENVFEKLSAIFEEDYGNTLRAVQYKNIRSGASDVISSMPVQMILTRTGTASGTGEANVAWGGIAGSAVTNSMDPAEWHMAPLCHLYVAACEDVDQYRTKVRPSIQAFVSQVEASLGPSGSRTPTTAGSTMTNPAMPGIGGNYLIVYVPLGGESKEKSTTTRPGEEAAAISSGNVRRALATQFAKARERIVNYQQDMDGSTHSLDSVGSGDKGAHDDEVDPPSMALQMLTTKDKLLYRKMVKDFPNGKVCVMSKSSLEKSPGGGTVASMTVNEEAGTVTRHQEWNAFNRMLGSVIMNGFFDRCRRYNDELRRLDSQRAMAAQAAKNQSKASNNAGYFAGSQKDSKSSPLTEFNLGYFFLVKESLAFTYEQMQLPAEALLQYDEFRAFLPDLSDAQYKKAIRLKRKSKALNDEVGPPLMALADTADFVGFRKRLRTEFDLTPILEVVRRYLFAREIRLLFKMERPVEVIARCEVFCKYMYSVMMRGIKTSTDVERNQREVEAGKWVVQFAWDVKTSCETYLSSVGADALTRLNSFDSLSEEILGIDGSRAAPSQAENEVASRLGELLEMARLIYKQLGDAELSNGNPLRRYEQSFPTDMFTMWDSWAYPDALQSDGGKPLVSRLLKESYGEGRRFILEDAFASSEGYEDTYLEIILAMVILGRFGQRRRLALRLQAELVEHLIRKGHLSIAAGILKSAVKVYRWDQWDRCHFWRLFRLAYCQRSTASATDYLKTLAACFSRRTSAAVPRKALEALHDDLERVIDHESIGKSKYGTVAFLETSIQVLDMASQTSRMGAGIDSKEIIKRFCSVGDKVGVKVTLFSTLPMEIKLDSLKLLIVDYATFLDIVENKDSVEEQDSFKTLKLDGGISLNPGANYFHFDWVPAISGMFILSTLEIVWKQGYFYYDSMELSAPLVGVDVLPSEPTHTISIEPAYLIPGHDQDVIITFEARSDIVTGGRLHLTCSEGLLMIGPREDPVTGNWKTEYNVQLGASKPGGKTVLKAHVRCALLDAQSRAPSIEAPAGLKAQAFVKYLHAVTETSDLPSRTEMKSVSEVLVSVSEKTVLSVESIDVVWMKTGERVLIGVDLLANTPGHFSILKCSLVLPSHLTMVGGVDHNGDLVNCVVSDGDKLSLAFECAVCDFNASAVRHNAVLRANLRSENEKSFSLDLPLDLSQLGDDLAKVSSSTTSASATASLKLAVEEGRVGEPIKLSFTVETAADGDIVYTIDPAGSEWLLSGKVSGSMQRSGFMSLGFMGTCEVIGIPTVPGVITSFPKIQLGTVSLQGGYRPLTMHSTSPGTFRSLANNSAVTVAFPSTKIAG